MGSGVGSGVGPGVGPGVVGVDAGEFVGVFVGIVAGAGVGSDGAAARGNVGPGVTSDAWTGVANAGGAIPPAKPIRFKV